MVALTGFLYGHYDSRGGATFLVSSSRNVADRNYAHLFGFEQRDFLGEKRWFWEGEITTPILKSDLTPTQMPGVCDEDFLIGPVELELPDGHPALSPVWQESDGRFPGGMELLECYGGWDKEGKPESAQWMGEIYALAKPGMTEAQYYGDEHHATTAKLRLVLTKDVPTKPTADGDGTEPQTTITDAEGTWYLTDFGEDAFGVILQFAVDNPEV
jgi:hypothetical protein